MTNIDGAITEDIRKTLAVGQSVYDSENKQVGTVDLIDYDAGYFTVQAPPSPEERDDPLMPKYLHVPFRLITTINALELFLSESRDQVRRDHANPPPRSTLVVDEGGGEVAITTEPSGYDGSPVIMKQVKIDELKSRIAVGDRVYTTQMTEVGKVKQYDPVTGWMLIGEGVLWNKHNLMVPVTLVEDVSRDAREVYLVASRADLQRMQHLEPAYVVFVGAKVREDS